MALIPSNTKKGLGFHKDAPSNKDWDFDKLSLGSSDLKKIVSLSTYAPDALNQGSTSSCVAHAFVCALFILEKHLTGAASLSSRRYLYWFSRFLHKANHLDAGTYLRSMADALRKFGVPDEAFWTWAQFTLSINKRPSVDAMGKGHARFDGKYVRIKDVGEFRTLAIKAALNAHLPVCFGTAVSKSYLENDGPDIVHLPKFDSADPSVGNHAQCIIGYNDELVPGRTLFEVQNSWSEKWRKAGRVYMTDEYIEDEVSSDFQIVYGWKALKEAA